ncbi:hypothetical protein NKR23_g1497 [Pleurostoma richardsiae]|uniref:Mitochondrial large ribosomal subunit n=1 Tax=Pleurostoma richardsiae TaxID=41990 RepID=A0AA38VWC5_9PEZI|nr:hypothetical protein NKR23_g1497 [Pleurostoma richardsiae]
MSLQLPSRRVLGAAPTTLRRLRPTITLPAPIAYYQQQQRTYKSFKDLFKFSRDKKQNDSSSSPSNDDPSKSAFGDLTTSAGRASLRSRLQGTERLGSGSIFADELAATAPPKTSTATEPQQAATHAASSANEIGASRLRSHLARGVDPDPRSRARWQRKVVMRHVATCLSPFGRETRQQRVARTERAYTAQSTLLGTSTKKLVHLARQVAGKTLDDAVVQMRFSKKRAARDVRSVLERAEARAVVERGMGLGRAGQEAEGAGAGARTDGETIQTKDGKWMTVEDPTRMYVAEAWVTKGPWRGMRIDYRARGRANIMKRPTAKINLVIKEEKTRIREHKERKAKEFRQGPWVHLPDRPVTAQRQYYSW